MSKATTVPALGSLRDRVQILSAAMTDEGKVFVPLATIWARVRAFPKSADNPDIATHHVVLRYRTDVEAGCQMVWRGRSFEVTEASDLNGRKAYLICNLRPARTLTEEE